MEEILKNVPRLWERPNEGLPLCTTVLMGPVANGPEQWTGGESHALAILIWVNQPNIFSSSNLLSTGGVSHALGSRQQIYFL